MKRGGGGRRRRRAQRMYGLLVRLYPATHRRAFGEQMVQAFGDHYADAVEGRGQGRLGFWRAVLADAGSSLLTEHAAETKVRRRRRPAVRKREGRAGGARVARPLRYRRRGHRPLRVVIRTRHHRLVYRGRIAALLVLVGLTGVALGTGTATGHLGIGALLAGLSVLAWLARTLRLNRLVPAGPRGDGPEPPGGASVREPRSPLPMSPSGSAARPRPDQGEPGQAVALI